MAEKRTVAHCVDPFLELTMVWAYDQVRSLSRYRAVVLTQTVRNREAFPFAPVYAAEALPGWRRAAYRVFRKARGMYAGYASVLRREDARLIHAHFGQEGVRCLAARRAAGVPMVTSFYGLDVSVLPRMRRWRRRFARLFAQGELFLAEGAFMGETLVGLGCPREKVCIQHLGVDLDRIPFGPPDAREQGAPVVLMYASFREKKGHVYGIRAFGRVLDAHPGACLWVIGDGPLRGEIDAEIRRLGIGDRVRLLGMRPHGFCLEALRGASILLYPSVTALDGDTEGGAPVGLIEAMASGVPVVSSLHADIPEVAPHGRGGLLVKERDVGGLAEALDALLKDSGLRARMGRAGRAHVEANHNLRVQAARLETIYDRVIWGC